MPDPHHNAQSDQYIFDLPYRPAQGLEDFFVTASNEAALAAVERWPDWRNPVLAIVGPASCGKSHLAAVWRSVSGARQILAADLKAGDVPELLSAAALHIENAPSPRLDENALFHAINFAREHSASILITTREFPARWPIRLPDLVSRLKGCETVELSPPDDGLLRAVLVKQFADRQIVVDERVVSYMMTRIERSFATLRDLIEEIDRRALAERAEVTRPFVARVLADFKGR